MKKYTTDYWFTIEPYVYISLTNKKVLLYNTLDRMTIESEQIEVIELLRGIIRKENCGVVLLKYEQYKQKIINDFIREIRNKYMGDIIDVSLSNSKPIQILPYVNFLKDNKIYKEQSFPRLKNIFDNLSEISIFVDMTTDLIKLIPFLQSIPGNQVFNIIGNIGEVKNYKELLFYFNKIPSHKRMIYSYKNIIPLLSIFNNNFSYKISINFPIDMQQWNNSNQILINQSLPVEYIFDVSSENDIQQAEQFVEKYQIIKFQLNPIYTGNNISFFEDNIFFTKDDILSTTISIKDIFSPISFKKINMGTFLKKNGSK